MKTPKHPSRRRILLEEHERIVTAFAQAAAGPGWANSPLWIIIANAVTGKWRQECLQPDEQTPEMALLYEFSALAHGRMTALVQRIATRSRRDEAAGSALHQ